MAREPIKNIGASVRVRLLQRTRTDRIDFQVLLTRYALERLLYRLSQSEHRSRFIRRRIVSAMDRCAQLRRLDLIPA